MDHQGQPSGAVDQLAKKARCTIPTASENSPRLPRLNEGGKSPPVPGNPLLPDALVLLAITLFILCHLSPAEILRDTTTVGGDTPAHNYIASHLRHTLLHHGRIISWASGWWGGFPLFQYYFPLPYIGIALLSLLIPFNVAFKILSISGLLLLPLSAYCAVRLLRFPRPTPLIAALFMVPFLFVRDHTMWGVNVASTLAGMISNSLSFALMLPAMASAWRDAVETRLRLRTVFLMSFVVVSHFFTSVMAGLTLAITPCLLFLQRRTFPRWHRSLLILAAEGALTFLLVAWWLVPLMAKSAWSMDFGVNWDMTLWKNFPPWTVALIPLALAAVFARGGTAGNPVDPPPPASSFLALWLFVWMLAVALVLFYFGYDVSPVFVNCRLWPFLFFALVMLGAIGLGLFLSRFRRQALLITVLTAVLLGAVAWDERHAGNLARNWSRWNFRGLEIKPSGGVFDELVLPLQGTPGRLANDLHPDNGRLGSSRIFELAPHLAGKPILEGGLVNSSIGSMFAYYIQSETSDSCAGYPPMVKPSSFDFATATRHLELFNVKHFIARSPRTQEALRRDSRWRLLKQEEQWQLYELLSHDGSYVFLPGFLPAVVETRNPNQCGLEWIYVPGALDQPFLLAEPGAAASLPPELPRLSEKEFLSFLDTARAQTADHSPAASWQVPVPRPPVNPVSDESVSDHSIRFRTTALGQPHIIKCNYFPNWKARGADEVHRVTPAFLLVFPARNEVELYYGWTASDRIGHWLTLAAWLIILGLAWQTVKATFLRRAGCAS